MADQIQKLQSQLQEVELSRSAASDSLNKAENTIMQLTHTNSEMEIKVQGLEQEFNKAAASILESKLERQVKDDDLLNLRNELAQVSCYTHSHLIFRKLLNS